MKKIFFILCFIFTTNSKADEFKCLLDSLNGEVRGEDTRTKIFHLDFFISSAKKYKRTWCQEWNFKRRWSSNNFKVREKIKKEKLLVPKIFANNELIVKRYLLGFYKDDYQRIFIRSMRYYYSVHDMKNADKYIKEHLGTYELVNNSVYFKLVYRKTNNYNILMKEII